MKIERELLRKFQKQNARLIPWPSLSKHWQYGWLRQHMVWMLARALCVFVSSITTLTFVHFLKCVCLHIYLVFPIRPCVRRRRPTRRIWATCELDPKRRPARWRRTRPELWRKSPRSTDWPWRTLSPTPSSTRTACWLWVHTHGLHTLIASWTPRLDQLKRLTLALRG